jgi:hypothetical protein
MRRDKKLADEILTTLVLDENSSMELGALVQKLKDKAEVSAIRYHVDLLEDSGLVTLSDAFPGSNGPEILFVRVTADGQDYFDSLENPKQSFFAD